MLATIKKKAKTLINYLRREKKFEEKLIAEGWQDRSETEFSFRGYYKFQKGDYVLVHNPDKELMLYYKYECIAKFKQYLTAKDITKICYITQVNAIQRQYLTLSSLVGMLDKGIIIQPNSKLHETLKNELNLFK